MAWGQLAIHPEKWLLEGPRDAGSDSCGHNRCRALPANRVKSFLRSPIYREGVRPIAAFSRKRWRFSVDSSPFFGRKASFGTRFFTRGRREAVRSILMLRPLRGKA